MAREIQPIKRGDLITLSHGIDLLNGSHGRIGEKSILYENLCFRYIVEALLKERQVAIGPHLIDRVFGASSETASFFRPDSMVFDKVNGKWVLRELYEFKSGETNGIANKKLPGFSVLLEYFRTRPKYLPRILARNLKTIGVNVPKKIDIPGDNQIKVTIVNQKENGGTFYPDTTFGMVQHLRLKASYLDA